MCKLKHKDFCNAECKFSCHIRWQLARIHKMLSFLSTLSGIIINGRLHMHYIHVLKETVRTFIHWCTFVRNLSPNTITLYMSHLKMIHNLRGVDDRSCTSFLSKTQIRGAKNLKFYSEEKCQVKKVMTLPLLKILGHSIANSDWSIAVNPSEQLCPVRWLPSPTLAMMFQLKGGGGGTVMLLRDTLDLVMRQKKSCLLNSLVLCVVTITMYK